MKKFTKFYAEQAAALKKCGANVIGVAVMLGLNADYDGKINATSRDLVAMLGYSDWRDVRKVLEVLAEKKFLSLEIGSRGIKIQLLQEEADCWENPANDFAGETPTPAQGKPLQSGGETPTNPLSSPLSYSHPINPADEYLINKQQENNKKEAKKRKQPALFAEQQDPLAGTFRAELTAKATPAQTFAKWYMQTIWPDMYATAKKAAVGSWFRRYGKALNAVLDCANGDVELCKEVTLACKARRDKNTFFKGEPPSLEYIAASWAQDLRTAMNQRRAHAAEEHARQMNEAKQKAAEAERKQREQEYWDSLTPEEKEKFGQYVSDDVKKGAK